MDTMTTDKKTHTLANYNDINDCLDTDL